MRTPSINLAAALMCLCLLLLSPAPQAFGAENTAQQASKVVLPTTTAASSTAAPANAPVETTAAAIWEKFSREVERQADKNFVLLRGTEIVSFKAPIQSSPELEMEPVEPLRRLPHWWATMATISAAQLVYGQWVPNTRWFSDFFMRDANGNYGYEGLINSLRTSPGADKPFFIAGKFGGKWVLSHLVPPEPNLRVKDVTVPESVTERVKKNTPPELLLSYWVENLDPENDDTFNAESQKHAQQMLRTLAKNEGAKVPDFGVAVENLIKARSLGKEAVKMAREEVMRKYREIDFSRQNRLLENLERFKAHALALGRGRDFRHADVVDQTFLTTQLDAKKVLLEEAFTEEELEAVAQAEKMKGLVDRCGYCASKISAQTAERYFMQSWRAQ